MIRTGILAALVATPALAQQAVCLPYADMIAQLENKSGETRRAYGFSGDGRWMEIYAADNGSWSIVYTDANKTACLVGAGDSFEALAPEAKGLPS